MKQKKWLFQGGYERNRNFSSPAAGPPPPQGEIFPYRIEMLYYLGARPGDNTQFTILGMHILPCIPLGPCLMPKTLASIKMIELMTLQYGVAVM